MAAPPGGYSMPSLRFRTPGDSRQILVDRRPTVEVDGMRSPRALGELTDAEQRLYFLQLATWRAAILVEEGQESRRMATLVDSTTMEELRSFDRGLASDWFRYRQARDAWRDAVREARRAR